MRVRLRFIAPVSLSPGAEEFSVDIPEGGTVRDVVREIVRQRGPDFERMICEVDGSPYVVFLVRNNAVSMDYGLSEADTVWVLLPSFGG